MAGFAGTTDLAARIIQQNTILRRFNQRPVDLTTKIAGVGHKAAIIGEFTVCRFQIVAEQA